MPTSDELFELKRQINTELTSEDRAVRNRAKKIGKMLRLYGKGPEGRHCRDCQHLYVKRLAGSYSKCALFGDTGGPGTDWQQRWDACGKFKERT